MKPGNAMNPAEERDAETAFLRFIGATTKSAGEVETLRRALRLAEQPIELSDEDILEGEKVRPVLLSLGAQIDAVRTDVEQTLQQEDFPEHMKTHIEGDIDPLMRHLKKMWKMMKSGKGMKNADTEKLLRHIVSVHPTISRHLLAKIWDQGLVTGNLGQIADAIFLPTDKMVMLSPIDYETFFEGDIEGNWQHHDSPSGERIWLSDMHWNDNSIENHAPPMFTQRGHIFRDERVCKKAIRNYTNEFMQSPNSFSRTFEKTKPMTEEVADPLWRALATEEEFQHCDDAAHLQRYVALYPESQPYVDGILSSEERCLRDTFTVSYEQSTKSHGAYLSAQGVASCIMELSGRLHSLITLLRGRIEHGQLDEAYEIFLFRAAEFERGRQQLSDVMKSDNGHLYMKPIIAHALAGTLIINNFGVKGADNSAEAIVSECEQSGKHPAIHAYEGLMVARDRLLLSMDQRAVLLS